MARAFTVGAAPAIADGESATVGTCYFQAEAGDTTFTKRVVYVVDTIVTEAELTSRKADVDAASTDYGLDLTTIAANKT